MGNVSLTNFRQISVGGASKLYSATLNMSSSYALNGDSVVISGTPFNTAITDMYVSANTITNNRYNLRFNPTTNKVLAYESIVDTVSTAHHHSLQVFEEVRPVVGSVTTSNFFPVCINAVYSLAGGVTGPMKVIPGDQVPATGECAVVLGGPKTFTFFGADAVTSAELSYLYVATTDDDIGNAAYTDFSQAAPASNLSSISYTVLLMGS